MPLVPGSRPGASRIAVEACVEVGDVEGLERSLVAARDGGADRVELCRDLGADGLTPQPEDVARARAVLGAPLGAPVGAPVELLALIRCRDGAFEFGADELARMDVELLACLEAGADGVVVGALRDGGLDVVAVSRWVDLARAGGARVGFHRAFDALADPVAGLEQLIDLGVDRVLCSGTTWGARGGAAAGAGRLAELVTAARGRIELVLAGGITPENAPDLLSRVDAPGARLSLHAAGGLLRAGVTDADRVAQLVAAARAARRAPSPPDRRS